MRITSFFIVKCNCFDFKPEGIDKVLAQIRICILETLEAVTLSKEKTELSTVSRKFTDVVQRCRCVVLKNNCAAFL